MRLQQYINEAREQMKGWKMYLNRNPELKTAVKILSQIEKKGYKAYLVGGCVRDIILGLDPHDVDIATNMPLGELEDLYKTHDIGKSKTFGIVVVNVGGYSFEVANFRKDGKYQDGRRPDKITISASFEKDVERRDFTINAMGIDKDGNIIDYFDGRRDIQNKVLRTVGDPKERFSEDYLRMMRLGRFSAKLGMHIDKPTKKAAQRLSKNIQDLSPERIKEELFKAASLGGKKFARYLEILDELKLLRYILPEVLNLKYFKQPLTHHPEGKTGDTLSGSVWTHVMKALETSNTKDPIKNLAILLHDIGKGVTLSFKGGIPRYYRHAEEGVSLVQDIAKRLKMSNKEKEALLFATSNHMKFHDILKMRPGKIVNLVNNDNWDVLVAVAKADEFSRGETFMYHGEFEKIIDKCVDIKNKWGIKQVSKINKYVDGNKIMKLLNIPPGPMVGKIKSQVIEWILDNNVKDEERIDDYIRSLI